ncbi:glucokinase [Parelusimicrobium proximum]|uniref:ROK family protein n=1 Tax=Parelusimicrobium proximum TaxID=3228953 RepID=UPI003D180AF8
MMKRKNYANDIRAVLTLDAGGTNLAFGAIRSNNDLIDTISLPSHADNLDKCLTNIVEGFKQVMENIKYKPVAISFAFPGPSDYAGGIIGNLPNFPAFRGGVALGPYLEDIFGLPVFINNDGDLFAYGEAMSGVLPELNSEFVKRGIDRKYNNLLGVTLGTGTGGGIVTNGDLFMGDNGAGAEIWDIRNKKFKDCFVEESASIRAVVREYKKLTGDKNTLLTPRDIFEMAEGAREGDADAAKQSFAEFGEILGDLLANIVTVVDGAVVLGGGLAASHKYFMPYVIKEMNGHLNTCDGKHQIPRMESKAFDMSDSRQREAFFEGGTVKVKVPYSNREVTYNSEKRIPIMISKLGTSRAAYLGAYAFALNALDRAGK